MGCCGGAAQPRLAAGCVNNPRGGLRGVRPLAAGATVLNLNPKVGIRMKAGGTKKRGAERPAIAETGRFQKEPG